MAADSINLRHSHSQRPLFVPVGSWSSQVEKRISPALLLALRESKGAHMHYDITGSYLEFQMQRNWVRTVGLVTTKRRYEDPEIPCLPGRVQLAYFSFPR
jgi:hypothetical protein